jgi:hypothetical protein
MTRLDPQVANNTSTFHLALWICSAALLAFGLTRYVIQIEVSIEGVLSDALDRQPAIGLLLQERGFKLSDVAPKLPPANTTRQSVISSTKRLYELKNYTPATLILIFSIILPILKQTLLLILLFFPRHSSKLLLSTFTVIHKWAMLDVFVLAMVVLALSSAAAWHATLLDGFYCFLGYIFTAGLLGFLLLSQRSRSSHERSVDHQSKELLGASSHV